MGSSVPMEKQKCLWSNMWHSRGCEDVPGLWREHVCAIPASFWLFPVTSLSLSSLLPESRSGKLHLQKAIAGAEPLEPLCCLDSIRASRQALHKAQQSLLW